MNEKLSTLSSKCQMDQQLGFNGILSTQVAGISCLRKLKLISKANGVYKRDY